MNTVNILQPPLPPLGKSCTWENLQGSSIGLALSALLAEHKMPLLIITPNAIEAERISNEIEFFQSEKNIIHFPDWETLPYDHFSPHQDIISERLTALNQIPTLTQGAIITQVSTLMQRIAPRDYLTAQTFILKKGDKLNLDELRKSLEKCGYRCVNQVCEHGEFAVRGSIIDLFPMGSELPFRIDLFDDEIDSLRTFLPDTQRTQEKIDQIKLLPAKEFPLTEDAIEYFRTRWRERFSGNPMNCSVYQDISEGICTPGIEYYLPLFFEHTQTLFDYLPKNILIITLHDTIKKSKEYWQEIQTRYEQYRHDAQRPLLNPTEIFLSSDEIQQQFTTHTHISIQSELNLQPIYHFNTKKPEEIIIDHKTKEPYAVLKNFVEQASSRILFCAETAGRREVLLPLLNRVHIYPKQYTHWQDFFSATEKVGIIVAPLDEGLTLENPDITLITESQLFGKRIAQKQTRKVTAQDTDAIIRNLTELEMGAPIVHIDHGVGRYLGLQTLDVGGAIAEFLTLEYADGDKLYVPVASLHLISRYSGTDPEHAPLHKLGSGHWEKAKRKAAEQVRDVAAELLEIYARRAAHSGFAFQSADEQITAFAASFPFEETPDQLRAINDTIEDMKKDKPMDRLVCGDVGFGKTEVAMRAAFFAVQSNKQVAVLVPTTLLAQQHLQTFQNRFADWPIRIEVLSRFKTAKEQRNIIDAISDGKVDIIIGTHKLLQNDIHFKNLGLLIIDEEHRFGVQQKERMKALRATVDILALTATPIPRTLNMAFSGIRDLSLIATPPARRLSIKTFVHEYQPAIIQEALVREIMRGGQVYFLHNDVATIEKMAREIEKMAPEARVGIAHGQMHERNLEQVMSDFYHRRFNVLVCTTIIESGIDVPSANTIIINRADRFGIAQLHQLRGRVGRSHHQAYAYLLIASYKTLTADAEKRLDAIASLEDLGIGFTLATHDLEIRGAGELLGEEQSGNMHEIGFTLYMDLLSRAVDALKSGKEPEFKFHLTASTEVNLQIPALIPENYLGDVQLRLQFYKRIATAKTQNELDEIQIEMIDRFGLLTDPIKNLFAVTTLKQTAENLGIKKIDVNAKGGRIEFSEKPNVDPMKIIQLIQKKSTQFKLDGPTKLKFTLAEHEAKSRIKLVEEILALLS